MADISKWYVVHTYSGYENKVASNIETVVENRKIHRLPQQGAAGTLHEAVPESGALLSGRRGNQGRPL